MPFPSPWGRWVRHGAASVRARCRAHGGQERAWQPSTRRGQPVQRVDRSADCCVDWRTSASERSEQRAVRPLTHTTALPSATRRLLTRASAPAAFTQAAACSASPRFWGVGARGRRCRMRWAARPRVMADRGVADAPALRQRRGSPLGERCQGSAWHQTGERGKGWPAPDARRPPPTAWVGPGAAASAMGPHAIWGRWARNVSVPVA